MTGNADAVTSVQLVAAEAFDLLDTGRQVAPFSSRLPRFDLDDAYRVTAAVRQMRETRGEIPLGRKIGFANRTIWDEYQIGAPMWGYIYDRTVHDLDDMGATVSLAGLAEPGIDGRALLGCVDWVAHGFELVQSIFPRWEFTLPDTVAAYGLHGKLLVGPRRSLAVHGDNWLGNLSTFGIELKRDGTVVDQGRASNVLGGPLSALRHLVEVLANDPVNPPLAAGEIVNTGTLTRAFPVAPGETWTTEPEGI